MKNFVAGMLVGAIAMYLYVTGLEPIVKSVERLWSRVSRPPAAVGP